MDNREDITPELLRQHIIYQPETGKLFWRNIEAKKECFTSNRKGYRIGKFLGKMFSAHRVAWAICYNEWPKGQIDHINHNRSDNRIINLRDVSVENNNRNLGMQKRNKTGITGVRYKHALKKWEARISINKRYIYLGYFASIEEAKRARSNANLIYGFYDNHGQQV